MKIVRLIIVALFGMFVTCAIGFIFLYFNAVNTGVRSENNLTAIWENNENILGQFKLKIAEMAQVTDMQRDDLVKLTEACMGGRYGKDGMKAAWAWVKEQNPMIDPSLYKNLQQVMDASRTNFELAQTKLVDVKKVYKNDLGGPLSGFFLRMAGYPKLKVGFPYGTEDQFKIISSGGARKAFETGVDEVTKLR